MRDRPSAQADRAERLRKAGLKATAPRLAILAELERGRHHLTVEGLHERLRRSSPSLSLSTVYHSVEAFLRVGLCRRVPGADGRQRVEGRLGPDHDHAVCHACGRVFDVPRRRADVPRPLPRLPRGLRVTAVRVEYEVICPACSRSEAAPPGTARRRQVSRT